MIEALDLLARDRPALARSLFIWQEMLGNSTTAAARLRGLVAPLVQLPLGADVTAHIVPVQPNPTGFDVHEAALPAADAMFAFVTESGLRLAAAIEPTADGRSLRRLQILGADGTHYRRQGAERFMLRYRLSPAIFAAQHIVFLAITQESGESVSRQPPLHAWIEVDHNGTRHFIVPDDSVGALLAPGEVARLLSFPPRALASLSSDAPTASLFIELIGDTIDTRLLGEALLAA